MPEFAGAAGVSTPQTITSILALGGALLSLFSLVFLLLLLVFLLVLLSF